MTQSQSIFDTASNAGLRAAEIAKYNDMFRRRFMTGGIPHVMGRTVMTASVAEKGPEFIALAAQAVAGDTDFTEDSDPYGDHSFGAVTVAGEKVLWKFDLYDEHYEYGSPEPTDLQQTRRVLTIMFPCDY